MTPLTLKRQNGVSAYFALLLLIVPFINSKGC